MGGLSPALSPAQVAWDEDHTPPGSLESEHILAVEETSSCAGGPGGPASGPHTYENVPSEQRAPAM